MQALDASAVVWGERALGMPTHETWWPTETGAIMIANCSGVSPRPEAIGKAMPGVGTAVLALGDELRARVTAGHIDVLESPDSVGELALRTPWPSLFRGYVNEPDRYANAFADGWYLTGDLARIDPGGWVSFVGRPGDLLGQP